MILRIIDIIEQSGTDLTDYQLKLDLTNYSLPNALSTGDDIYFIDKDDNLLSFYKAVFNGTSEGDTKLFYVKIPVLPASSTVRIYMIWNSDYTNLSSGEDTFLIFDDFNSTSLNTDKWNVNVANSATYTLENGKLKITSAASYWSGVFIYGKQEVPLPCIIETYTMRDGAYSGGELGQAIGITELSPAGSGSHYGEPYPSWLGGIYRYNYYSRYNKLSEIDSSDSVVTSSFGSNSSNLGVWIHEIMVAESDSVSLTLEELSETLSITPTNSYASPTVTLGYGEYNSVHNTYYDWIFARKYVDPEPLVSISEVYRVNDISHLSIGKILAPRVGVLG